MGTFGIQRAQRGITPASGSVRANINVDTGAGAVGAAVVGLGTEAVNLGKRYEIIEAKAQLSESSVAAADEINTFLDSLGENDDPETYGQEFGKLSERIDALTPTNSKAANIFRQNMATRSLQTAKFTRDAAKAKIEQKSQFSDFLLLQEAKKTGDFTSYNAAIINGVKLGVYTAQRGESMLDDSASEQAIAGVNLAVGNAFGVWEET